MESSSEILRKKANKMLSKLKPETDFYEYSNSAFKIMNLYNESAKISENNSDYLKSIKNIVIANIRFFLKCLKDVQTLNNYDFLTYQFRELYNSYLNLLSITKDQIESKGLVSHLKKLHKLLSLYLSYSSQNQTIKYEDNIIFLQKLNKDFGWNYSNLKFLILSKIQSKYFNQGITHFEKESYLKASSFFNNTIEIGNEAIHYFKNFKNFDFENHIIYDEMITNSFYFNFSDCENLENYSNLNEDNGYSDYCSLTDLIEDLGNLNEEAQSYLIKCEINSNLIYANKLFSEAIEEDESINMEIIYDSLDVYRIALQQTNFLNTKNKPDVELEAILCSKLGYIFFKIFKNYSKAKSFLNQAVSLGLSLYPKNISSERWYIKATTALQDIRLILQENEDSEISKKKEKYLEELKDVLKKIDDECEKVRKDKKEHFAKFLKFLIINHSPTKKTFDFNVEEEIKKSSEKKILLKLIKFYHPDSNGLEEMKARVLIEEIAKRLNDIYSLYKGE